MKNKLFLCLLAPLSLGIITACNSKKDTSVEINIGTKLSSSTEISTYDDLRAKLNENSTENFLLATYSKAYSTGCSCWSGFRMEIMDKFVSETQTPIYYFDVDKLTQKTEFGISKLYESSPEFYVIKGSKVVRKYTYLQKTNNIMKSYNNFKEEMDKVIVRPDSYNLYYVDENFIDKNLAAAENAVLLTVRSGCGDCRYALPHVVEPMSKLKQFKNEIWIFDIQSYMGNDFTYLSIKQKLQLNEAGNELFGYKDGKVPTIQYYENGFLKDACVYFNDVLVQDGENYKISETYYTKERISKLTFIKKSLTTINPLLGLSIPSSDVTNGYWNHEAASVYHTPILKAFITNYCL